MRLEKIADPEPGRLEVEQMLDADVRERDWPREVERHERIADRLRCLLQDLGGDEPQPRVVAT